MSWGGFRPIRRPMPDIHLPTFHPRQAEIYLQRGQYNAVRCGRRFGKTLMMTTIAGSAACYRKKVGLFTPERKQLQEPYDMLLQALSPIKRQASKTAGTIRTTTRGIIDFWALNDNLLAGRGREYDIILIDEAGFTKNRQMNEIFNKSIKPTLLTTHGSAWAFSTPNGNDPDNFFFDICNDKSQGWTEFYAPTASNPRIPAEWIEEERLKNHPLVFQQEYLAEFVDWTGVQFFDVQNLLLNGQPVEAPAKCDVVFAIIDSATKTGKQHDGTGVVYCAFTRYPNPSLVILDYDLVQIEGALLENWLPQVHLNCEAFARQCHARNGSVGSMIEDKASGMILIQQAKRRGLPSNAIDSKLTELGKDERAISVSGYVYRGMVKISRQAYDRLVVFKNRSKNHFLGQVIGFRLADKERDREDDLLDCFCYAIAVTLGNAKGF
jgi:hypothetical protein